LNPLPNQSEAPTDHGSDDLERCLLRIPFPSLAPVVVDPPNHKLVMPDGAPGISSLDYSALGVEAY
jgi:hypothetical protein